MKLQFKLAAAALAFVSVSAFAADIDSTTILGVTPFIADVAALQAVFDGATATDLAAAKSNAIIFQDTTAAGSVAIIDQTGANFAVIGQSGQAGTALIYQNAAGNAAAIFQK